MFSSRGKKKRTGPRDEVLPEQNDGLPDSERPSGLCPRCGKQSSFENLGSLPLTFDYKSYFQDGSGEVSQKRTARVTPLTCRHGRQGVAVVEEQGVGNKPAKHLAGGDVSHRGIHWWPLPDVQSSPDIPAEIAAVFAEAASALHA